MGRRTDIKDSIDTRQRHILDSTMHRYHLTSCHTTMSERASEPVEQKHGVNRHRICALLGLLGVCVRIVNFSGPAPVTMDNGDDRAATSHSSIGSEECEYRGRCRELVPPVGDNVLVYWEMRNWDWRLGTRVGRVIAKRMTLNRPEDAKTVSERTVAQNGTLSVP